MTESDRKYYENREIAEKKHKAALSKAQNRGIASEVWHRINKLTPDTLADFKKAMKRADKEWEASNN